MTMKILVAGGAGFIGSNLCRRLLGHGHEVFCVDNFSSGVEANVLGLAACPRFHFVHHDITTPVHLDVDCIYNLACPASPFFFTSMIPLPL